MSRKGILLSDPSVKEMSHMQWLIEAAAIAQRERDERERSSKLLSEVYKSATQAFRETLVHLLGLNIGAGTPKMLEDGTKSEHTPFIPLLMTMGRHEVVEELMKRDEEEKTTANALENKDLDGANELFMSFDAGDLEPILQGYNSDDPLERWKSKEHQQMLKELGIVVTGLEDEGDGEESRSNGG